MQHGSKMIKLDVNRKGHHKKTFVLDKDMTEIRYEPSKKNSRCKFNFLIFFIVGLYLGYNFCLEMTAAVLTLKRDFLFKNYALENEKIFEYLHNIYIQ